MVGGKKVNTFRLKRQKKIVSIIFDDGWNSQEGEYLLREGSPMERKRDRDIVYVCVCEREREREREQMKQAKHHK